MDNETTIRIQFKNGSHIRARGILFVEDAGRSAIKALSPSISDDQYARVSSISGMSTSLLTPEGPILKSVLFWASDVSSFTVH